MGTLKNKCKLKSKQYMPFSSPKAKFYKVMIEEQNFLMGNNKIAKGFIAPRIIQAFSPKQAIELAMETILDDETLQSAVQNTPSDSPSLFVDTIEEITEITQSEFTEAQENANKKYFFYDED